MSDALFDALPCGNCGAKLRISHSERAKKQALCRKCGTTNLIEDVLKKEKDVVREMKRTFKDVNIRIDL